MHLSAFLGDNARRHVQQGTCYAVVVIVIVCQNGNCFIIGWDNHKIAIILASTECILHNNTHLLLFLYHIYLIWSCSECINKHYAWEKNYVQGVPYHLGLLFGTIKCECDARHHVSLGKQTRTYLTTQIWQINMPRSHLYREMDKHL